MKRKRKPYSERHIPWPVLWLSTFMAFAVIERAEGDVSAEDFMSSLDARILFKAKQRL